MREKANQFGNVKFIKEELDMMALAGTIQGNTVIIDNDSITNSYFAY